MENLVNTQEEPNVLFHPLRVGAFFLEHRIVHPPVSRLRADDNDTPSDIMLDYYTQRATQGGLIIAEAASISLNGRTSLGGPGLYRDDQIERWKTFTDAIHQKGGIVLVQLFHAGRRTNSKIIGGGLPVTASAGLVNSISRTPDGFEESTPAAEATLEGIREIVENFRLAAIRAKAAGFDGVELNAANGYLIDQFLQDGTNHRTDIYGGPVENRARLLLDVTKTLIGVWGADRVGVRISPSTQFGDMFDSDPNLTFGYVAEQLNNLRIAYLHIIEPRIKGDEEIEDITSPVASEYIRKIFDGIIIAAGGFNRQSAIEIIERGDADLVSFGRHFTSNPDLPHRLLHNYPLTPYVRAAFYGGTELDYSDFSYYESQPDSIEHV